MDLLDYERPREKLRYRGAQYLSMLELIQLVISSGNARVSGAKLAREVTTLIKSHRVSYASLVNTNGIGVAKACQILAAIELGSRLATLQNQQKVLTENQHQGLVSEVRRQGNVGVTCFWFDGSMRRIDSKQYVIGKGEHSSLLVKRLFADVLVVSARTIAVIIMVKRKDLLPNTHDLSFIKSMQDTAGLLHVGITRVTAISQQGEADWGSQI